MSFLIVIATLLLLIVLIAYFKVDAFLSFILISIIAAIGLGIPMNEIPKMMDTGVGNTLASLTLILLLGAMLGKLVAESGAAKQIADMMVWIFGTKYVQWGLMVAGFIVGIPLFYDISFVLLVPLVFSVVNQYKLPAVYTGLPMLAALSVTHGFLPPHPSPTFLTTMFHANIGVTLLLGLCIAVPTILIAGPLFSQTVKNIKTGPITLFEQKEPDTRFRIPGKANSLFTATLPVMLLIFFTILTYLLTFVVQQEVPFVSFLGSPSIVMLLSLLVATFTLGILQGRSMKQVMDIYIEAVKDVSMMLFIVAGSGIFKQVMVESGVNSQIASAFEQLPLHPLVLAWIITAVIRVCIGSATVAALTGASIVQPLIEQAAIHPSLLVLSIGAGSLFFSHVNDSGFWLFKEYFNLNLKDTFRSWTIMQSIVSVVGLLFVMLLNIFI